MLGESSPFMAEVFRIVKYDNLPIHHIYTTYIGYSHDISPLIPQIYGSLPSGKSHGFHPVRDPAARRCPQCLAAEEMGTLWMWDVEPNNNRNLSNQNGRNNGNRLIIYICKSI